MGSALSDWTDETMEIKFITTGGTIDKVYFDARSEFDVGDPQIGVILKEAQVALDYSVVQLMRKDSLDLTPEDRQQIFDTVAQDSCKRFVITHGTDTITETARVLKPLKGKIIVLTGALTPARFRSSDAIFNIGMAVAAVQMMPEGVYIVMNGRIFVGDRVKKNLAENRFEPI